MNKIQPEHYQRGSIEPIQLIQAQHLNFCLGNVIKYVCRAGKKPGETSLDDLQKARQYLDFEIEFIREHLKITGGKHESH